MAHDQTTPPKNPAVPPAANSSFFSISYSFVPTGKPLPYDLFVNSSSLESREKFVRIFPQGESMGDKDLADFRQKYRQLYVAENQRGLYLNSICKIKGKDGVEKAAVLKDSAIHYLERLFDQKQDFSSEVLSEMVGGCKDVVENMVDVLHDYDIDQLKDLIGNLSFHDFYTYDHSINVSMYCILIYRFLKPEAPKHEIVQAGLGGLLHDLGKIKIPTQIINKPDRLDPSEFAEIQKHPSYGCELLESSRPQLPKDVDFELIRRIIFEHHENFDGTGYPNKVAGADIHLMARITSIADFFDAVTTKRSYHRPMGTEDALALMANSVGKKIDPALFELFVKHTMHFEQQRASRMEVGADFDPCQPHSTLPLKRVAQPTAGSEDFGKINLIGKREELKGWANQSNVRVIDPPKTSPTGKPRKTGT